MSAPPSTWIHVIVSESSTSAMTAAMNGCRLPIRVARDGPTRSTALNQRMFASTSGPSVV